MSKKPVTGPEKIHKPTAAQRTVDLFTGKTEADIKITFDDSDSKDAPREPAETIEVSAERWRQNAFYTQEYVSENFGKVVTKIEGGASVLSPSDFRLTTKGDWMYLERFGKVVTGPVAVSYTGVMFPLSDLYRIASVFVQAARARKSSEPNS